MAHPGTTVSPEFRSWVDVNNYSAHYSAQYAGGALGPMVIHGPTTADYDVDIGPVILTDWYHSDYFTLVSDTMKGAVPLSNNNLVSEPDLPSSGACSYCDPRSTAR